MKTFTAARAKTNFGEFLDASQREPVIVTKNNRPVSVIMSIEEYAENFSNDAILKSHAKGYLSHEESEAIMQKYLNAEA